MQIKTDRIQNNKPQQNTMKMLYKKVQNDWITITFLELTQNNFFRMMSRVT